MPNLLRYVLLQCADLLTYLPQILQLLFDQFNFPQQGLAPCPQCDLDKSLCTGSTLQLIFLLLTLLNVTLNTHL